MREKDREITSKGQRAKRVRGHPYARTHTHTQTHTHEVLDALAVYCRAGRKRVREER